MRSKSDLTKRIHQFMLGVVVLGWLYAFGIMVSSPYQHAMELFANIMIFGVLMLVMMSQWVPEPFARSPKVVDCSLVEGRLVDRRPGRFDNTEIWTIYLNPSDAVDLCPDKIVYPNSFISFLISTFNMGAVIEIEANPNLFFEHKLSKQKAPVYFYARYWDGSTPDTQEAESSLFEFTELNKKLDYYKKKYENVRSENREIREENMATVRQMVDYVELVKQKLGTEAPKPTFLESKRVVQEET